jgi:hypothetical protein
MGSYNVSSLAFGIEIKDSDLEAAKEVPGTEIVFYGLWDSPKVFLAISDSLNMVDSKTINPKKRIEDKKFTLSKEFQEFIVDNKYDISDFGQYLLYYEY